MELVGREDEEAGSPRPFRGWVVHGLIGAYWGADPIYYSDSKNEEEAGAAKLCCKILEAVRTAKEGEANEKDS